MKHIYEHIFMLIGLQREPTEKYFLCWLRRKMMFPKVDIAGTIILIKTMISHTYCRVTQKTD